MALPWRHSAYRHTDAVDGVSAADGVEPHWRVRHTALPWWKRWLDRRLAQADVTAPDGTGYQVRVVRNLPLRESPLGPFDEFVPQHLSLAALVGANLYARGRTGWSVQVLRPETPWRSARVIHARRIRGGAEVADAALALVASVQRGELPWENPRREPLRLTVKKIMNWD